jgi:methylated-DNA-[protein]-cysteine S-methyltransferase
MTTATGSTLDTPIGPFTAVVDPTAPCSRRAGPPSWTSWCPQVHPTLRPAELVPGGSRRRWPRDHPLPRRRPVRVDDVRVRQRSGAFLEHAWDVLRTIPAARPVTYTEYAAKSGRPLAVRAAAAACARNAAALFVPCHGCCAPTARWAGSAGGWPPSAGSSPTSPPERGRRIRWARSIRHRGSSAAGRCTALACCRSRSGSAAGRPAAVAGRVRSSPSELDGGPVEVVEQTERLPGSGRRRVQQDASPVGRVDLAVA